MVHMERVVIIGLLLLGGCAWQDVKDNSKKVGYVVLSGISGLAQQDQPQTFHRRGNYICDQNEICVGGNQVQPH